MEYVHEEEPPQAIKYDEDFLRRFITIETYMKRLVDMMSKMELPQIERR